MAPNTEHTSPRSSAPAGSKLRTSRLGVSQAQPADAGVPRPRYPWVALVCLAKARSACFRARFQGEFAQTPTWPQSQIDDRQFLQFRFHLLCQRPRETYRARDLFYLGVADLL